MPKSALAPTAARDMASYVRANLAGRITIEQIDKICGTKSSKAQFTHIIGPLVKDGVLTPDGSCTKLVRGNPQQPIYAAYNVCAKLPNTLRNSHDIMLGQQRIDDTLALVAELDEALTQNGHLARNPEATLAWQDELKAVSLWLKAHPEPVWPAVSEERSFEIFGNEKRLGAREKRGGVTLQALLGSAGIKARLSIDDVPSNELVYYVPRTPRRTITVLVVENHAPFARVQAALAAGVRVFFGRHVDGVIYGEGFKCIFGGAIGITEGYFSEGRTVRYLYWGDIDRPGIEIMERLLETWDMEPLVGAYEAMIECAGSQTLPQAGPQRLPPHMGVSIASKLSPEALECFMRVLAEGLRIPQEAVPKARYDGSEVPKRLSVTLRSRRHRA